MRGIVVQSSDTGPKLVWSHVPEPHVGEGEILIEVHATAVNRADLLQAAGLYPAPPGASEILGLEIAGTIVNRPVMALGLEVGDRVCALLSGGGYAERVAVSEELLMPMPEGWKFQYAAAIPEIFYTAHLNLFMEAGLRPGESVLVHGGASGVGTAAIQLAAMAGCRVFAVAGTPGKLAKCQELGAEVGINRHEEDFVERVSGHTDGKGVDVILDIVGAGNLDRNIRTLATGGRLVIIGLMGGAHDQINLAAVLRRRLRIVGSVLRSRSIDEKAEIRRSFMKRFWDALVDGTIGPVIDSVVPIERTGEAHEKMAANQNTGKIVLAVRGSDGC